MARRSTQILAVNKRVLQNQPEQESETETETESVVFSKSYNVMAVTCLILIHFNLNLFFGS